MCARGFHGCGRFLLQPLALGGLVLADALGLFRCRLGVGLRLCCICIGGLRGTERVQELRLALRELAFGGCDRRRRFGGRRLVSRPLVGQPDVRPRLSRSIAIVAGRDV